MAPYFRSSDLRRLSQGSFEHLIARLSEALSESHVFEDGVQHSVVATFPDHVLVATSDERVARVPFSESENGIEMGTPEFLPVTSFNKEEQTKVLQAEVRETLRGLLKNEPEAGQRLASLVAHIH